MSLLLASNNAVTTLAASISSTATSLSVVSGAGALFPNPTSGQFFRFTLVKAGVPTTFEICLCTARSTDTFASIQRAQEGTTALSWSAGDTVALFPTAGDLADFAQFDDLQKQLGNYAIDTGSANAYSVALSPALVAHVVGMPIRWKAAHANTGASTFTDGVGAGSLVLAPGVATPSGVIVSGGMYASVWDGTQFQLSYAPNLSGYATLADLSPYATIADLSPYALINSQTFTGIPKAPTAAPGTSTTQLATTAFANIAAAETYGTGTVDSCVWPNGFIENWGVLTTPGSSPTTVTFHTPFTAKIFNIVPNCLSVFQEVFPSYPFTNLNSFTLNFGAGGQTVGWRAIGY